MGIATAIVGSAILGAASSHSAAKKQASAANNAANLQMSQYQQTRADQAPWRETGANALARLDRASTGDMTDFTTSPSYNFVRSEGQRDIGNNFSARGSQLSGNALRALTQYNQNLASTEYGNWWNRQAGLAGVGQTATQATGQAGSYAAANASNSMLAAGQARASGVQGINDYAQNALYDWQVNRLTQPTGVVQRQAFNWQQQPWAGSSSSFRNWLQR